jgi:hypothetical protein
VSDAVPLPVCDCEPVGVPLAVIDAVGLADTLTVDVAEGVTEELGVPLALPPALSVGVGVAVAVFDKLTVLEPLVVVDGVREGVHDELPVPVFVGEPVGVPEGEFDGGGVGVVALVRGSCRVPRRPRRFLVRFLR